MSLSQLNILGSTSTLPLVIGLPFKRLEVTPPLVLVLNSGDPQGCELGPLLSLPSSRLLFMYVWSCLCFSFLIFAPLSCQQSKKEMKSCPSGVSLSKRDMNLKSLCSSLTKIHLHRLSYSHNASLCECSVNLNATWRRHYFPPSVCLLFKKKKNAHPASLSINSGNERCKCTLNMRKKLMK